MLASIDDPDTPALSSDDAREFELEELFCSFTNKAGRIKACNDVFARVSDIPMEKLLGAPHSIVRHPDTPRGVFKVLWDGLKDGRGIAAYVKNRAADGRYYWVLAMAIPAGGGYLSVRIKPSTPLFSKIRDLYQTVSTHERNLEAKGVQRSEVIDASVTMIGEGLADLGFNSYEDFQNIALPTEIRSRRQSLGHSSRNTGYAVEGYEVQDDALVDLTADDEDASTWEAAPPNGIELGDVNRRTLRWVLVLFDQLEELVAASEGLAKRSRSLLSLAQSIHIFALNAGIASSRLGGEGSALIAVTWALQGTSREIVRTIEHSTKEIDHSIASMRKIGFAISVGTMQSEMIEFMETTAGAADRRQSGYRLMGRPLLEALNGEVSLVLSLAETIATSLDEVSKHGDRLTGLLDSLQFTLLAGRIEIARVQQTHGLTDMFSEVSRQLTEAGGEIRSFEDEIGAASSLIDQFDLVGGSVVASELEELQSRA